MPVTRIISADSHFVEPPDVFTSRLPPALRDRAPRTMIADLPDGRSGEFFTAPHIDPQAIAGTYSAGKTTDEMLEINKKGYAGAPDFVKNPAARLAEQDRDGVSAEVLYTSWGLFLFTIDDNELRAACFRAFNDWAAEFCSFDPKRLIGCGIIEPVDGVAPAVKELERIAGLGLHACMISGSTGEDLPYGNRHYDPFWATAEALGMPVSLHILTSRRGFQIIPRTLDDSAGLVNYITRIAHEIQVTCAQMITGGVFERFPNLKVILAEADIAWIPGFLTRADHYYSKFDYYEHRLGLSMLPSEYFKRNVTATFQFEGPNLAHVVNTLGSSNLMWASDFPHMDSTYPNTSEYLRTMLADLPQNDVDNISHATAERIFGLR